MEVGLVRIFGTEELVEHGVDGCFVGLGVNDRLVGGPVGLIEEEIADLAFVTPVALEVDPFTVEDERSDHTLVDGAGGIAGIGIADRDGVGAPQSLGPAGRVGPRQIVDCRCRFGVVTGNYLVAVGLDGDGAGHLVDHHTNVAELEGPYAKGSRQQCLVACAGHSAGYGPGHLYVGLVEDAGLDERS